MGEDSKYGRGSLPRRIICGVARASGSYSRPAATIPRVYSVLLADEFALVRYGIAAICKSSARYRIVGECSDGLAAAGAIVSLKPDLAILELNLPELHGTEVIRRVRQAGVETRFLAVSARHDTRTALEALRAGANGFLLKSDPAAHLLEALQQILEGGLYVSPKLGLKQMLEQRRRGRPSEDPLASLSVREHQVFSLLVEGLRPKQIANHLDLSLKTVNTYRSNLMRKLEIYDLPGLVKFAIQRNLTSLA